MKRRFSRRDVLKGSAALGLTAMSASVKAAAPEPTAITPALVEAAKKEGKIVLYSSMDLPVGEKLGKAFEAAYPGISVQIERSGSERLFQRIDQEFASNIRAADVINTSDASHTIPWKKKNWLAPFVPEDVAKHFPEQYRDPDGMFALTRIYLSSIAYNTTLVKAEDAPKSFADLLDAKWAGKMVKGHPAYSGTIMTATFQMVREFGWEYYEKLAKQRVIVAAGIADPASFAAQVRAAGAGVQLMAYQDHHAYPPKDVARLAQAGKEADYVVVTEKDAVKLRDRWPADAPEPLVAELALRWELNGDAVERVLNGVLKRVV
jgi:iron(III) transport system substrate-binding protein